MEELKSLIAELRTRNEKHGCSAHDISAFCDKADVLVASFEYGDDAIEEEGDFEDDDLDAQ